MLIGLFHRRRNLATKIFADFLPKGQFQPPGKLVLWMVRDPCMRSSSGCIWGWYSSIISCWVYAIPPVYPPGRSASISVLTNWTQPTSWPGGGVGMAWSHPVEPSPFASHSHQFFSRCRRLNPSNGGHIPWSGSPIDHSVSCILFFYSHECSGSGCSARLRLIIISFVLWSAPRSFVPLLCLFFSWELILAYFPIEIFQGNELEAFQSFRPTEFFGSRFSTGVCTDRGRPKWLHRFSSPSEWFCSALPTFGFVVLLFTKEVRVMNFLVHALVCTGGGNANGYIIGFSSDISPGNLKVRLTFFPSKSLRRQGPKKIRRIMTSTNRPIFFPRTFKPLSRFLPRFHIF